MNWETKGKSRTPCGSCVGRGVVNENQKVEIKIPPGADNNTNLRCTSQGDAGPNGGPRGHLWVKVRVREHPVFKRDGADIHVNVQVGFTTALLGGYVDVPGLSETVQVKVTKNIIIHNNR